MKKTLLAFSALFFMAALSSCDLKTCYCYYYTSDRNVYEETETTGADQSCNALSTGDGQIGTRTCVEYNERMDPGDMASKHKRVK